MEETVMLPLNVSDATQAYFHKLSSRFIYLDKMLCIPDSPRQPTLPFKKYGL